MLSFWAKYFFLIIFVSSTLFAIENTAKELDYQQLHVQYHENYKKSKKEKNYQKAIDYLLQIIDLKKEYHEDNNSIATNYNDIGGLYKKMKQYKKALIFYQKDLKLTQQTVGENHLSTAISHNSIGKIYVLLKKNKKSLNSFQKALTINKNLFGENHPFSTIIYNNIAKTYTNIGDNSNALIFHQKALAIQLLSKENLSLATTYNNIGLTYKELGKYDQATHNIKKALKISIAILGKKHKYIAKVYTNLGLIFELRASYDKALKYYLLSLSIKEKELKKNHSSFITNYNNIAGLYRSIGQFGTALNYYKKAINNDKKNHNNSYQSATIYNNMGSLYKEMGEYSKAIQYYKKALNINKQALGNSHPLFLPTLYNNLSFVYTNTAKYKKALYYAQLTLDLLPKKHPLIGDTYNNLGLLYNYRGDYNKVLKYYKKALVMKEEILGGKHPTIATILNNIGFVYKSKGQYNNALKYVQEALKLRQTIFTKNHISLFNSYDSLASIYYLSKNYRSAYGNSNTALSIFIKNRNRNLIILDSHEKQKYVQDNTSLIELLLTIGNKYLLQLEHNDIGISKKIKNNLFNKWLNYKGTLFEYQNILSMLKSNPNSSEESKQNIRKLNKSNILLSKLSNQFPKNPTKIKVIEETIHQLEIQLSQNNNSFKNLLKLNDINSTQISSQLQENQLYIDFARGEDNYYIFTVDHNNTINFLQIDENDTNIVDLNIKAFHHNSKQMAKKIKENSLSISLKKTSKKEAQDILQQLHTTIIDKYLKKIILSKNHLIISADGLLNFLPFEALYNHKSYFIEKYKISYVSSGKELLRQVSHGHKSKSSNVVVFGSPNFWLNLQTSSKTKSTITKDNATIFDIKFSSLESSKEEIGIMKKYYPNIEIYTDSNATIENLFTLKSPKILHISTHGFFLNNKNNPNPMLASGLAFAGANYANYKDDARGIATALQLTGLELQNTELVVLSACETALGKIHNAEGVTGLSKAFIQAGAKKVVMSLWKVSVQETITTMHYFYANIHAGNNYATALRQAKLHMITMHPYYWSAFIMSGI